MSEAAAKPIPRRGRVWVVLGFLVALFLLGYVIVDVSTREGGSNVVEVEGLGSSQRTFGGLPQEGDRLGSSDAPISIQIFNDMQCANCREDFVTIVPELVERYVRPGDAQMLMRHYSVSRSPLELGFFGAEAAAEQGYGWQYTYLFFVNQDEAERFGVGERVMASLAASIEGLDVPTWEADLEEKGAPDGPIAARLEGYEELGRKLQIRLGQGVVVSGPGGTRILQEGPGLDEIEAAIAAVG